MTELEMVRFALQLAYASDTPVEERRYLAGLLLDIAEHEAPADDLVRHVAWEFATIHKSEMARIRSEQGSEPKAPCGCLFKFF